MSRLASLRPVNGVGLGLAALALAACTHGGAPRTAAPAKGGGDTPAATVASADPPAGGAGSTTRSPWPVPPPPPSSQAPRYHAQNQSYGTLRGFSVPPVARRKPPKLVHVTCLLDETVAAPRHRCRPLTAAAARAADGDLSMEELPLMRWLRGSLGMVDGAATAALARTIEGQLDGAEGKTSPAGLIVAITVTRRYTYAEMKAFGCEHANGHPCDPIAQPTGRQLVGEEGSGPILTHRGASLDLDVALDGVLALVNGTVEYQTVELALPFGERGDPPAPLDLVNALHQPDSARRAIAALAASPPADPALALILAYDRAVAAARLADLPALKAAMADVDRARAAPVSAPGLDGMLAEAEPFLRRILAGKLVFTPPAGLAAYVSPRW